MNIRLAKPEDKSQIFILLDELIFEVNKTKKGTPISADSKERERMFQDVINRQDIKIFVAEENGKLLGMGDLFIDPILRRGSYFGHLEDLVVTESMRGKGIGGMILEEVKKYCKKHNIKVLRLTSGLELISAHEFYEKHGGKFTEKMFRFEF